MRLDESGWGVSPENQEKYDRLMASADDYDDKALDFALEAGEARQNADYCRGKANALVAVDVADAQVVEIGLAELRGRNNEAHHE